MKKKYFLFIAFLLLSKLYAQATYNASNYAVVGDSFYISSASDLNVDFETTGTNFNWNFQNLTATSQIQLQYRNPTQTGYSAFLFPFIYFSGNTNLSSTDGSVTAINIPGQAITISEPNDYYKTSATSLKQVASAFKLSYNGLTIPVQNQYTTPDFIYQFPINYGNTNTSNSEYTTSIPSIYYRNRKLERTNTVDGWGTVTTPHGTFSNALRITTNLVENDTIALAGTGLPRIIRTSRELKWLDISKKIPVLTVTQTNLNGIWTTTKVDFLDNFQTFQTTAFFLYSPLAPTAGSTVSFQNLSSNATTYSWNFDDPTSVALNTDTAQNPNHIFNANGTYQVTLTASNSAYTNTVTIPVVVSDILSVASINQKEELLVYPIPFSNRINLKNEPIDAEYELLDSNGKILFKGNNINNEDFSYLSKGIYLLKIKDKSSSKTVKILK